MAPGVVDASKYAEAAEHEAWVAKEAAAEPTAEDRGGIQRGLCALRAWFYTVEASSDLPYSNRQGALGDVVLVPCVDERGRATSAACAAFATTGDAGGAGGEVLTFDEESSVPRSVDELASYEQGKDATRLPQLLRTFDEDLMAASGLFLFDWRRRDLWHAAAVSDPRAKLAFDAARCLCLSPALHHWETPYQRAHAARRTTAPGTAPPCIDRPARFFYHLSKALQVAAATRGLWAPLDTGRARELKVHDEAATHLVPPVMVRAGAAEAHRAAWAGLSDAQYVQLMRRRYLACACLWRAARNRAGKGTMETMQMHGRCPACGTVGVQPGDWGDVMDLQSFPAFVAMMRPPLECAKCGVRHSLCHVGAAVAFRP